METHLVFFVTDWYIFEVWVRLICVLVEIRGINISKMTQSLWEYSSVE